MRLIVFSMLFWQTIKLWRSPMETDTISEISFLLNSRETNGVFFISELIHIHWACDR